MPSEHHGHLFFREVEEDMARFYRDTLRSLGYSGLFSQYNYYKFHHYDLLRRNLDYVVLNNYFAHPTNWMQAGSTLVAKAPSPGATTSSGNSPPYASSGSRW